MDGNEETNDLELNSGQRGPFYEGHKMTGVDSNSGHFTNAAPPELKNILVNQIMADYRAYRKTSF